MPFGKIMAKFKEAKSKSKDDKVTDKTDKTDSRKKKKGQVSTGPSKDFMKKFRMAS
jgi:hypothetical protein